MKTYGRFVSAQRAYDDMEPECFDDYICTDAGAEWLESAARELADGNDQVWTTPGTGFGGRNRHGVTFEDLRQQLADDDDIYERLVSHAHRVACTGVIDQNFELFCSEYRAKAIEIAREMLAEYGNARGQYECENSEY